jgi:hypothetical protein
VPDFSDLTLLPFCVGLTLLGLIGSWAAAKRRGPTAGVRGVAWSLLPVSLYLTGLLEMLWDVVKAASDWIVNLVFSPSVWAGVALFGVSVVLFVLTGVRRGRGKSAEAEGKGKGEKSVGATERAAGEITATGPAPASASKKKQPKKKSADADAGEFDEIEDILKRHGIN